VTVLCCAALPANVLPCVLQDPENDNPSRPLGSPTLCLHAFDLDLHKWSIVHAGGSIPFQKLEALQCHRNQLIAVGWSPVSGNSDNHMQVCPQALQLNRSSSTWHSAHLQVRCADPCTASTGSPADYGFWQYASSCKHKLPCRCASWT
jgi:hypothetical protein